MVVRRLDVLVLVVLVTARVRIDTLADLVAPRTIETIQKVAWLNALLSPDAWKLMADWLTDPLSLLLISVTFALVLAYIIVDLLGERHMSGDGNAHAEGYAAQGPVPAAPVAHFRFKLLLVLAIVATTVMAQSAYLVALRHIAGPATYTHDGGVIQTEETIKFLLQGKNPYVEDYTQTPMADWGLDYKTALYHYPYLPWTFLFSLPFFLASNAMFGWFDERFVYLLLFALMLLIAVRLAPTPMSKLVLLMVLGLNPIMGSDVIFGQNDSFVLFWIAAALWLARRGWTDDDVPGAAHGSAYRLMAGVAFALACASKPTAWFLAPFFLAYVIGERPVLPPEEARIARVKHLVARIAPFVLTFLLIVLPFLLWDPYHFYDDVWAWSAGTSPTAYQIRGWGVSNFVLALNLVPSRLAYFPFWIPELLVSLPVLLLTLRAQWRDNSLPNVTWHGAILFLTFAFTSRFLNENYLGFVVSLLTLGALMAGPVRGGLRRTAPDSHAA